MEEETVARIQETQMDVDAAATEVKCGSEQVSVKETSVKMAILVEEKEQTFHGDQESCDSATLKEVVEASKEIEVVDSEMASLREELQGTQERMVEKEKFEETLMSTILELSAKQDQVNEMSTELELLRRSESRLKQDLLEDESLVEEIQVRLKEEVEAKNSIEASFRSQIFKLQEELAQEVDNSQLLKADVANLTQNLEEMKERLIDVESELNVSREEFARVDAIAADAVVINSELDHKLKSLKELHQESEACAAQKILELENQLSLVVSKYDDAQRELKEQSVELSQLSIKLEAAVTEKVQISYEAQQFSGKVSDLEAELKELNKRCDERESRANAMLARNIKLEDLVRNSLARVEDSETKVSELQLLLETKSKEYADMVYATSSLEKEIQVAAERERGLESDKEQMRCRLQDLESALAQQSELVAQAKELRVEDERRANAMNERNQELEELVRSLHFRVEDSNRRVSELEFLLESGKSRISDLEQEIEMKSVQYSDRLSALTTQLEAAEMKNIELDDQLTYLKSLHFRVEDSNRRVSELEFLLESGKSRISDLEQEIEMKSVQYSDRLSALTTQLEAAEMKNIELDDQLTYLKSSYDDAVRKLKQQSVEVDSIKEQMSFHVARISELESALSQSLLLKSQLDAELNEINERCDQHEIEANLAQECILELQDLVRFLDSRAEDSEKRVSELVLSLETRESRIIQLEQEVESKSKQHAGMVSALTLEVEKFCLAKTSLQNALEMATENQKRLEESLETIITEKRRFEEAANDTMIKLHDAENLLQLLQNELIATQGKLESTGIKEIEITRKLESAEAQLQQKGRVLEESVARTEELMEIVKKKESEVNFLYEKLHIQEYQAAEEAVKVAELTKELKGSATKIASLERMIVDAESRATELVSANIILKDKVGETEARLMQALKQLHESIQELTRKEAQVEEFSDKCSNLEEKLKIHEAKVSELLGTTESTRAELEMNLVKVQNQQHIIQGLEVEAAAVREENMSLEFKMNHLKLKLSEAVAEKEYAVENLKTSVKVNEDLKQELASERHSFQTMIASIMEEKQLLYEANRDTQIELQTIKAELETLNLQATQTCVTMQTRVQEPEKVHLGAEFQFEKEVENVFELHGKVQQLEEELVSPPTANIQLGHCPAELKNIPKKSKEEMKKRKKEGKEEGPLNHIKVAVGVGLVSVVAAILAGKKN